MRRAGQTKLTRVQFLSGWLTRITAFARDLADGEHAT